MAPKSTIPLHYLKDQTDGEFYIRRLDEVELDVLSSMESHRDEYCNFLFQEKGSTRFMVDFTEINIEGCTVFCILPGQVHSPLSAAGTSGWFVAVDMLLLSANHRSALEAYVLGAEPVGISRHRSELLEKCLRLLSEVADSPDIDCYQSVSRSMLQVCLDLFVSIFQEQNQSDPIHNLRPATITRQFKSMLMKNYKTMKSPFEYAHELNITPSYLNETVKQTTGLTVSHLIHQQIIMEAKRLLCFTDLSVKQIAFSLGYEDHTYFSRLFRKVTHSSPGKFKSEYRN